MFSIYPLEKGFAFMRNSKKCRTAFRKLLTFLIAFIFIFSSIAPSYAQGALSLPAPGSMVLPSPAFVPVLLKGMKIYSDDPLRFDFIVDNGNSNFSSDEVREESQKLLRYFLASVTIPKDDLWVNLSPTENDRIIPDALAKTDLGRDLLAQDYLLKQLTASLIYPEDELGKEFWQRVYSKSYEQFGTTQIPVDTFNKVWILPESASVYENGETVYVIEAKLKVMLDEDYAALENSTQSIVDSKEKDLNAKRSTIASNILREVIIPEIEKEINQGKNFAPLRQIYYSLILAQWYKDKIKSSLLSGFYADQKKIAGIEITNKDFKDKIYDQYMQAYKKGVYDFIKTERDVATEKIIPRKYFSGGFRSKKVTRNPGTGINPVGDNYNLSMRMRSNEKGEGKVGSSIIGTVNAFRKLIELSREKLHKALPGIRDKKYDSDSFNRITGHYKALPFEGISVIHNISTDEAKEMKLSVMALEFKRRLKAARLERLFAFVDLDSFHATTFDLINEPETKANFENSKLNPAGAEHHKYIKVRQDIEKATFAFLRDGDGKGYVVPNLNAKVRIEGVGMFAPGVVKLTLKIVNEDDFKAFQEYRRKLQAYLEENVIGYKNFVRQEVGDPAAHLTFGYTMKNLSEEEIVAYISVLEGINEDFSEGGKFSGIEFNMTQGEVTAFSDMDHFKAVKNPNKDSVIKWTVPWYLKRLSNKDFSKRLSAIEALRKRIDLRAIEAVKIFDELVKKISIFTGKEELYLIRQKVAEFLPQTIKFKEDGFDFEIEHQGDLSEAISIVPVLSREQLNRLDKAQELYGFTDSDREYYANLWVQMPLEGEQLKIILDRKDKKPDENFILASLMTPEERKEILGSYSYREIAADPENAKAAKRAVVTINSLDGGIGESLNRLKFLQTQARKAGMSEKEVQKIRMGAKGTDLGYIITRDSKEIFISVAEAKLLQLINLAKEKKFSGMKLQPIVNWQSKFSYENLLEQPTFHERLQGKQEGQSYREALTEAKVEVLEMIEQKDVPWIEQESNTLALDDLKQGLDYKQVGGHAQLGFLFLYDIIKTPIEKSNKKSFRVFYNGDNINSRADEHVIGWMIRNNFPIVKLTVMATSIDKKGGKDGARITKVNGKDVYVPAQMEKADAVLAGQEEAFYSAGQEGGIGEEGKQPFNTNIFYIDESLLSEIFEELKKVEKYADVKEILKVIAPTLIKKPFEQKHKKNGDDRYFRPIDGAIGTVMHNLSEFFQTATNPQVKKILSDRGIDRLLFFVDVPRTPFFSPTKNPFDIFLQANTDYYEFNSGFSLDDSQEGLVPPGVDLEDPNDKEYWKEYQNYVDAFGYLKVQKLEYFKVRGKVKMQNARLIGDVVILNGSEEEVDLNTLPELDLYKKDGELILEDISITINEDVSKINIEKIDRKAGSMIVVRWTRAWNLKRLSGTDPQKRLRAVKRLGSKKDYEEALRLSKRDGDFRATYYPKIPEIRGSIEREPYSMSYDPTWVTVEGKPAIPARVEVMPISFDQVKVSDTVKAPFKSLALDRSLISFDQLMSDYADWKTYSDAIKLLDELKVSDTDRVTFHSLALDRSLNFEVMKGAALKLRALGLTFDEVVLLLEERLEKLFFRINDETRKMDDGQSFGGGSRAESDPRHIDLKFNIEKIKKVISGKASSSIGGINLKEIAVDRQGSVSSAIKFDPAAVQSVLDMNVNIFRPVIIDLVPISGSLLPFLGLEDSEGKLDNLALLN